MMSRAKIRVWCMALLVLLMTAVASKNAPAQGSQGQQGRSAWKRIIVKCGPEDLDRIRRFVGAAIVDAGHGHYLLTVPALTDIRNIQSLQGKGPIEADDDERIVIQRRAPQPSSVSSTTTSSPALGGPTTYFGAPAREGYVNQPAVGKISLKKALNVATGAGIRVAIIDTGIDERHPTLKSVILQGKNYVGRTPFPSELDDLLLDQNLAAFLDQNLAAFLDQNLAAFLDQNLAAFLDQNLAAFLDQNLAAFLDQNLAAFLDQNLAAFLDQNSSQPLHTQFGHGTMMAGLVHLVAPSARIIPLKAFDISGGASEWNIVRAIYDAVDMDADVISMSFSSPQKSKLIQKALEFATSRGVVVVGSAGNAGSEVPTYPAAVESVVAVSALDLNDQKADFSNYGNYIDLSAPGVNLISTYPGGHWAIASGVSDAVPLVSGVFALAKQAGTRGHSVRERVEESADSLNIPAQYRNKLGKGRINAFGAVTSGIGRGND